MSEDSFPDQLTKCREHRAGVLQRLLGRLGEELARLLGQEGRDVPRLAAVIRSVLRDGAPSA
jgi:hypothetical protein